MARAEDQANPGANTARVLIVFIFGAVIAGQFSIALSQGLMILTGLTWLGGLFARRPVDHVVRLPLLVPIMVFLLASLISAVLSDNLAAGLVELRTSWVPFVFFFACVNTLTRAQSIRLVRVLIAAGLASALFGLTQAISNGPGYRIHGTLSHYMTFAGLLLVVLLLALAQLLLWRSASRDGWLLVGAAGLFVALLMTQTRSAWLGLAAGAAVLTGLTQRKVLLALPLLAALFWLFGPAPVRERMRSLGDLRDTTLTERVSMWKSGAAMFLDHPITGVGPGNVRSSYPSYKAADDPWLEHGHFTHLHSNIVQLAAERGSLGLFAWLSLWVAFLWASALVWRGGAPEQPEVRSLTVGSIAVVVAFLVAGLFEYNFGDSEVINLVAFAMALPFVAPAPGLPVLDSKRVLAGDRARS